MSLRFRDKRAGMKMPAQYDAAQLRAGAMAVWMVIAIMLATLAFGYSVTGLSVDFWGGRYVLPLVPACAAIAWFYRRVRPDPWIANGAEAVAQVMLMLIIGTLLSYAAAIPAPPYRDAELEALDRALGLDWRACLDFINAHPLVGIVSNLAYFSMKPQSILVIGALVFAGRFGRLQVFSLATALTLVITIAIFAFVPAQAYFAHLGLSPADSPNFSPTMTYQHLVQLEGIRNGTMRVIHFDNLEGLITFPSFHTAAALLAIWALWPCRSLRLAIVVLNVAMVASTPFDGAHYFIDLPAGALVATFAIFAASHLHANFTSRISSASPSVGAGEIEPVRPTRTA